MEYDIPVENKKVYIIHCDRLHYEISHVNCNVYKWQGKMFAKWVAFDLEYSDKQFAFSKEELREKLNALVQEDLKFVEEQYKTNLNYLNNLLNNEPKITEL